MMRSLIGWAAAYPRRSWLLLTTLVVLHLGASASTLLNTATLGSVGGCALALPCLFAVVLVAGVTAATVVSSSVCKPRKAESGPPSSADASE